MVNHRYHFGFYFLPFGRDDARRLRLDEPFVADLLHRLARDFHAFAHLGNSDQVPGVAIGLRARWDVERELLVGGIRESLAIVEGYPGGSQPGTGRAERNQVLGGYVANTLQASLPDGVCRQEGLVFIDARRHYVKEPLYMLAPASRRL